MKLKIDTSNNIKTTIELGDIILSEGRKTPSDQNVLEIIEKALKIKKIKMTDIQSVEIKTGPGSFTGLRVGAAIANALSFTANISINGKKIGEIISPTY